MSKVFQAVRFSLMVALALLSGCFDVGEGGGGGGVPPQLMGRWRNINGSGTSYFDPSTGHYQGTNASQFTYQFYGDGTYEHAALMQSALYSCTMTITGWERGTADWTSSTVTVTPKQSTFHSADTCRADYNYDAPGTTNVHTFTWFMERDPYNGEQDLILVWPNGDQDRFHPD